MAIIKKKVRNSTYVYDMIAYRENGKVKHKWKILGKLDADGNVIPSKKKASAEAVSIESIKASLNSLDSLNTQNSQNVNGVNGLENNNGNDNNTIITAPTNVTLATNTTTMPVSPVTATMGATTTMTSTAMNKTIATTAVTAMTTVANNSSDTTHNNTSDMMLDMKTNTNTTPVATDSAFYYDISAKAPTEAPIDAVYYESYEAQISPVTCVASASNVIIDDISDIAPKTEATKGTEITPVSNPPSIPTKLGKQNTPALPDAQDTAELVVIVDTTQESTGENPSQLPQVTSQKAEQFKVNMSKLENIAFTPSKNVSVYGATDINTIKVNVSRGKSPKKRIETLLYIDFNDAKANGLDISHEDRLTPYDREVHNAVATLAAAGNICINPYMIFQVLSGNSSDKTKSGMSPETRENIVKSLNKMRGTNIKINASAEVKTGMILEGTIESYLIPAKRTEAMLNGQIVKDCIHLYDVLPLFNYAGMKNQIASVDVKMLDTPLANTPENIVLKCYVLKRILSISNEKNNMHDVIRYSTVYKYLDIQAPKNNNKAGKDLLNHKRKQIRDKIRKLLNYWKGEKLIKDYREEKEGKTLAKVIIFVF